MDRRLWIVAVILLLTASLACSLVGRGATEQPGAGGEAATPAGTEVQEPAEETGGETAPPPEVSSNALAGLNSYRARIAYRWATDSGTVESMVVEMDETREPPARRYRVSSEDEAEAVEYVQIGNTAWYCFGGTCGQTEQDPEEAIEQFGADLKFDPAGFLSGDYRYAGRETVNGIACRHYELLLSPAEVAAITASEDVTDVEAEAWIADESGLPSFVVRFILTWRGTTNGQPGEGQYQYDIYEVNSAFTIEPPEGAPTGLPEDIPLYPNASGVSLMQGMASFTTSDAVEAVGQFYKDQLPGMGWTLQEETAISGTIMQTWVKGDRSLSVMVSSSDSTTQVVLMEQ